MAPMRKLGRTSDQRKAMLRAMVTYLFENGKIETTVTRAKEVRSMAEKMITIAKDDSLHSKRQVYSYITKESVAKKLCDEAAERYAAIEQEDFKNVFNRADGCGAQQRNLFGQQPLG